MNEQRNPGLMSRLKGFMFKRMHSMITCKEFEDFVLAYLDDSLPDAQKKKFDWHMRICRDCREYLAAYRRTIEMGKTALGPAHESVPSEVPEDLIKAVLNSRDS